MSYKVYSIFTPTQIYTRYSIRDYRIWDLRLLLMDAMATEAVEDIKPEVIKCFDELNTLTERMDAILQRMIQNQEENDVAHCKHCSVVHDDYSQHDRNGELIPEEGK